MRSFCSRPATAALIVAGAATAIGYLAPWWPKADIPNQFTPFILAVAVAGLALLAFELRSLATHGRAQLALATGLAGLAAINIAPLRTALATTAVAAQGPTDTLTVVSFNIWTKNQRLDDVSRWLLDQNADVIILQEMTSKNREPIKGRSCRPIRTSTTAAAATSSCSRASPGSPPAVSRARPSSRRCRG